MAWLVPGCRPVQQPAIGQQVHDRDRELLALRFGHDIPPASLSVVGKNLAVAAQHPEFCGAERRQLRRTLIGSLSKQSLGLCNVTSARIGHYEFASY